MKRVVANAVVVAVVLGTAIGVARARDQGAGAGMASVEITNGTIVVAVLPPLGGRVVTLKKAGGENLLDVDEKLLRPPYPVASIDTPFRPWNGRIVWVGPQSGVWSQQDLKPDLKKEKAVWPPDPFNETGRFEVRERTPTRVVLEGTSSPVTGLSFVHEYEITGERTVRMKTTATNRRATPVAWDLWPNTRFRTDAWPYVLLDPAQMLRMDGPALRDPDAGLYPSRSDAGWLTLPPGRKPEGGRKRIWAKAFVRPSRGLIACFVGKQLVLVTAPVVAKAKLHPEQAFIELYRAAGKGTDILEVEMHGPYETLAPGASMSFEQTFEVLDYDGPADPTAYVARLAQLAERP
jgi:hypothetical protein